MATYFVASRPAPKAVLSTQGCDGTHEAGPCSLSKLVDGSRDARANVGKTSFPREGADGSSFTLHGAHVVTQPDDSSCLFHALCWSLAEGSASPEAAEDLRRDLTAFIEHNPDREIG